MIYLAMIGLLIILAFLYLIYQSKNLITAFQTHFHWSDLTRAFLELKRILKPDGIILLACEWSKLAYYLPDFTKQEKLENYLTDLDLHLIDSQRKDQWILYKIMKNKEVPMKQLFYVHILQESRTCSDNMRPKSNWANMCFLSRRLEM